MKLCLKFGVNINRHKNEDDGVSYYGNVSDKVALFQHPAGWCRLQLCARVMDGIALCALPRPGSSEEQKCNSLQIIVNV